MGGQTGSSSDKTPICIVPTSTQLRRAKLESKWWALQADGTAPAPLCLQVYGKQYAALLERQCGQHRRDHQRCVRSKKLDPLNMASWYPLCGEPFEMENSCASSLLAEVDKRCRAPLDQAASALQSAKGDQADPRLKAPLEAVGKCMTQVVSVKGLAVQVDAAAVRERFAASKRLMAR